MCLIEETCTVHSMAAHLCESLCLCVCVCVCERERERERERFIHLRFLSFQMRQATAKQVMSVIQKQQDVGYKTKVVGGVVHRVPIKEGVRHHL